jgi:hypothetical protein
VIVSIVYTSTYNGNPADVMAHGSTFSEAVTMLLKSVEVGQVTPKLFRAIAELSAIHSGESAFPAETPKEWSNVVMVEGSKDSLRLRVVTPMDLDPVYQRCAQAECKVLRRRSMELQVDIDKLLGTEKNFGPFEVFAHQHIGDALSSVARVLHLFHTYVA